MPRNSCEPMLPSAPSRRRSRTSPSRRNPSRSPSSKVTRPSPTSGRSSGRCRASRHISRTRRSAPSIPPLAPSSRVRSVGSCRRTTACPTAATSSSGTSRTGGAQMRDVIVIGAGGGGAVAAKELAALGLDVLVLEAGAAWRPDVDWTHYEIDQANSTSGVLRFGPSDRTRPPWPRELGQQGMLWQVAGVGGTTQHYYGNSPRAYPGVFRGYDGADAGAYDRAHEFPLSYRDLVPYYEWVEATLPVETAAMGRKEEAFFRGASSSALGLTVQRSKTATRAGYRAQENAILQPRGLAGNVENPAFPAAYGCTFCGHCLEGCKEPLGSPRNLRAKRSVDNSYAPLALTADLWTNGRAATFVTDAFVTRIETDPGNGQTRIARGVTWRSTRTGEVHSESARVVVLAAGAIETPRLWQLSSLPDPNGWVGRGLTDHYLDLVVGVMPGDIGSSHGPSSAARVDFPGRGALENAGAMPATTALSLTVSDSGMAGLYDNGSPVGAAGADGV